MPDFLAVANAWGSIFRLDLSISSYYNSDSSVVGFGHALSVTFFSQKHVHLPRVPRCLQGKTVERFRQGLDFRCSLLPTMTLQAAAVGVDPLHWLEECLGPHQIN